MTTEVVISGIGCLISKTTGMTEFQEYMLNNADALGPAPWTAGELNVCSQVHTLLENDVFDSIVFGMHRQQAQITSSLQKMVLERSVEALIDAGVHPVEISGKNIGVYMSCEISESNSCLYGNESGFTLTGQVNSLIANRVSYFLNISGPSANFYSTWNGGMETLQFAVETIRAGESEAALVGVGNMTRTSSVSYAFDQLGLLADDGITKAFDDAANGYGRGEAVVVMFIQRADLAKRHYATILHVSLSYHGNCEGTQIEKDATNFENFLEGCYASSGVNPHDVQYLEAYGCGVKKIDELEMAVIEEVFCKDRPTPLLVGSVKPSVGHTDAAADFVSILKVLVAMESGVIPATLHHKTPNRNIPALINGKVEIVIKNRVWNGGIAAVNSIGYSNSFGHLILRSNSHQKVVKPTTDLPLLTVFSARTEDGLNRIIDTIQAQSDLEYSRLVHNVFQYNLNGFLQRGYTIQGAKPKAVTEVSAGDKKPIWFIYSGMGSQWHTMGRDLMVIPTFAQSIYNCHTILATKQLDLLKIITNDDPTMFDNILHSFVGISAIQIALTDVLRSVEIIPAGIIGHSVGELGCAYADGCLTAEEVILGAYYRGIASQEADLEKGMMAAVGLGAKKMASFCPPQIDIACHNSPSSCTISGPVEAMETFVNTLKATGVFARLVNVSNLAYHSRYIQPVGPVLLKYLRQVLKNPKKRSSKWISTSIPQSRWNTDLARTGSAEYFTNNLLSAVYFEENAAFIPDNAVAIEIAPHGILQAILKRSLEGVTNIPLTKRNCDGVDFLLNALGKLYLSGTEFKLAALYPNIAYPVSRGTRSTVDLVQWNHEEHWPVVGVMQAMPLQLVEYSVSSNDEQYSYIIDMQINNRYVLPPSLFLGLVYQLMKSSKAVDNVTFKDVIFHDYENYTMTDTLKLDVGMHKGSGKFEISSNNNMLVSGYANMEPLEKILEVNDASADSTVIQNELQMNDFYKEFADRGYTHTGQLKSVKSISITEKGIIGLVKWESDWKLFLEAMLQIYCFHAGEAEQNMLIPTFIRYLNISVAKLPQQAKDIEVTFCRNTGIMNSPAMNLCYVQFGSIKPLVQDIKVDYLTVTKNKANIQPKAISTNNYKIINIKCKNYSSTDVTNSAKGWANDLTDLVSDKAAKDNQRIFVTTKTLPDEGIDVFVNKLQEYSKHSRLRFVFILDQNAPECLDNAFYKHIFERDMLVSILKDGNWTNHVCVSDVSVKNQHKIIDSVILSTLSSNFTKTCKVAYVGVNSRELMPCPTKCDQFEIGHLDYAGISPSNKKMMGIAWTDLTACDAEPDATFIWPVPENWTLSDAATVPHAFVLAYYILFEMAKLKRGQSVLINVGCTAFSQAAIRIAIAHECSVYTTVATENQRLHLRTAIPQLCNDHIMDSENTNFEWELLWKRNGIGIDLVINSLPGNRLHAAKRCVTYYSTFVQLGIRKEDEHYGTGSKHFNNNLAFFGLLPQSIQHLDSDVKARLHEHISAGIKRNIVAPITKILYNLNEVCDMTRNLQSLELKGALVLKMMNETTLSKRTLYRCDKNGIYIIYGGNPDSWINLVEWLTNRGAKTLLIVTTSHQNPNYINRRLTLTNRIHKTNIIVTMEHAQTISDLMTTAASLGLIKDIFVFGSNFESVCKTVNHIDSITKNQKIVCLLETNAGIFYVTRNIVTIKWQSKRSFMDAVNILDEILQSPGQDFVLKNEKSLLKHKNEENDIVTFYPKYLEDIKILGRTMPMTTTFLHLPTACHRASRNVPPVFVIPGVSGFKCPSMKHFLSGILSPVYGIQVSCQDLDINYAASISQKILKNYESSYYNIIGVSFGGLVAIEIAKSLENAGVQVQLTLIDGSPSTVKNFTKVFNTNDAFKKKLLSRLNLTLTEDSVDFERGISILEAFTRYSNAYAAHEQFLGNTYSIRPRNSDSDDFGVIQYCKKVKMEFMDGDHRTMLHENKLVAFINEKIEYLD